MRRRRGRHSPLDMAPGLGALALAVVLVVVSSQPSSARRCGVRELRARV